MSGFRQLVVVACAAFLAQVAIAAPADDAKPAGKAKPPTTLNALARPVRGAAAECHEIENAFAHYLPGLVDFCLGEHDWAKGRYKNAVEWLKLGAGYGSKSAQYMLGLMYYDGDHVTKDPALGIAWLKLANERHDNKLIELVTRSAIHYATPSVLRRAEQQFLVMRKRYGDKVAARRAWEQYTNYQKLVAWQMGGGLGDPSSGCIVVTNGPGRGSCESVDAFDNGPLGLWAAHYFHGWTGRVKVGPLKQVPVTSAPTHRDVRHFPRRKP